MKLYYAPPPRNLRLRLLTCPCLTSGDGYHKTAA